MTAIQQSPGESASPAEQHLLAEVARLQKSNAELQVRLAETEDWFGGLLDNMADGLVVFDWLADGDFSITYANRHASEIFGVSFEDLTGSNFLRFVHGDDQERIIARKSAALLGEDVGESTYRAIRADGAIIWITTRSGVVYRSPRDASRTRIITSIRDITEERNRAAALSSARERLDQILNVIPGVFYHLSTDREGAFKVQFVSDNVMELYGISVSDAQTPGYFQSMAMVDLLTTRLAALESANSKGVGSAFYPVRLHGEVIWVRDTMRQVRMADGRKEIVGFLADATAERRNEVLLRRLVWAQAAQARSLAVLLRAGRLDELMARICDSIVEEPVYVLACFAIPEHSAGYPVRMLARSGPAAAYLDEIKISWKEGDKFGSGPSGLAMREGIPHICRDTWTDPSYAAWRKDGDRHGFRSTVTVPCSLNGKVVGALLVYASEPDAFGETELALFEGLSAEIGLAIGFETDRILLREAEAARKQAEENLSASVQLGPGLLYRARVSTDRVSIVALYGDPAPVLKQTESFEDGQATLAEILGTQERSVAIRNCPQGATLGEDYLITTTTHRPYWLRNTVRIIGHEADVVEIIGYISDVTQEKMLELHRQQVTTLLTLGELATGMAHELNQPLASILLASENASNRLHGQPLVIADVEAKLQKIIAETHRAGRLIDHMRIFARNEKEQPQPIHWHQILTSALEILVGKVSRTSVVNAIPDYLPHVMGWPIPMEQILINLIGNAVDIYQERGIMNGMVITVEGEVDGTDVVLRVKDQAGGIPPDVLPRVFEPFFTTRPVGKGTGLGLAITADAVKAMGGTISAANDDRGALFEIRLPAAL